MTRPRKQLLLKLGVFLLLGAIVNVAVAWGFGLMQYRRDFRYVAQERQAVEQSLPLWQRHALSGWPAQPEECTEYAIIGQGETIMSASFITAGQADFAFVRAIRFGLPTQSVGYEERSSNLAPLNFKYILFRFGFSSVKAERFVIPIKPIWPGFAINTIFYAAILWLLWIAPGRIRRFIRIRRHRCPACGYEIAEGVGPRCSECGVSLARNGKNQSP